MENLKNYCDLFEQSFEDEKTGQLITYQRVMWHFGNTVIELVPTKKSKQALQVLVDLGVVEVKR